MAILKKKEALVSQPGQLFPIVGIGASAGGLEAFKRLVQAIPEDSGMAYVLVQHLSPSHESLLPEILSRATNIPVHEITNDVKILPDNIYVIPANKILTSVDGRLSLAARDERKLNHIIDIFFTSLAEVHQNFAIGIVLSGTGSDGSAGLKAIKEHGGITFAQECQTAAYDGMPQSAVDTGIVDFILAPEEIPGQLRKTKYMYATTTPQEENGELTKDEEAAFRQILLVLRQFSGVDFTCYKQPTLCRRIARRMKVHNTQTLAGYLQILQNDQEEKALLYHDVLIPVTGFFRDPKFFQALTDTVLPALYKQRTGSDPIRIWVAGCSTGEEAYSLAMCLHDFLGDTFSASKLQIFATDISEVAIAKARRAVYTKAAVEALSEVQRSNYFIKTNGSFQVNKPIRDVCVFAIHNFLKDPPFARMNLVSCRNVLIYMDVFLQNKALTTFHYALKENGFLLLGKSETAGTASELFSPFSRHEKIYSRKQAPGRFFPIVSERREGAIDEKHKAVFTTKMPDTDFRKNAEAILLSKYTPAAVIVNEHMDIVHIHGSLTTFLEPPPGKPTYNLIKMACEGLGFELRNALHKSWENNTDIIKENITVRKKGKQYPVTIEIIPLRNSEEQYSLVLFHKVLLPATPESNKREEAVSSQQLILKEARHQIQQLEKELAQTREDMRSITEEQEGAYEELQSANEELLSSSEELQSLNEELETSKEELESSNEELTVVNNELTDKQEQLGEALLYAENIIATIREPLVILDKSLRIRSANDSFYKKFNTNELETEGKLFYELQGHQWDDNVLRSLLQKILPGKEEIKDFEILIRFSSKSERVMLMNAKQIISKNSVNLILLAIEDITERKRAEAKLEESEKQFRQLAETIPLVVWTATAEGKRNYFNRYLLNYTGFTFDELKDDDWHRYISPIDQEVAEEKWKLSIAAGAPFVVENRIRRYDGDYRWHKTQAVPQIDSNGRIVSWVGIGIEIEEERVKEKERDDFINIASHELKTPITSLKGYVQIMQEMFATADDQISLQLVARVNRQTERLTRLVNNLFDVTRMKEGLLLLNKSSFNIDSLIIEVGDAIQAGSTSHLVVMDLKAKKNVVADRERIEQVLVNLMSNAIKYSPGADKIFITSFVKNGVVTICVQDFGVGVSEQMQARIFDRYFRVNNDNLNQNTGLGLGLYIASAIVNLHGGKIKVSSEINEGATFCFSLPLTS